MLLTFVLHHKGGLSAPILSRGQNGEAAKAAFTVKDITQKDGCTDPERNLRIRMRLGMGMRVRGSKRNPSPLPMVGD